MANKTIELSEKLQEKINNELTEEQIKEIYTSFKKYNLVVYWYKYITDSDFRRAVFLHDFVNSQKDHHIFEQVAGECKSTNHDTTMKNICRYWYNNLEYKSDILNYGKEEKWATVDEIIAKGSDDCEAFMLLILCTALKAEVPEYRLFGTIGWVKGTNGKIGHAYVTYIANNLVMYSIDGTFFPKESMQFKTPYFENERYYYGTQEWARFNTKETLKLK